MQFGFINNFKTRLTQDVSTSSGGIRIASSGDEISAILSTGRKLALTVVKKDEQGNEVKREIIYPYSVTTDSETGDTLVLANRAQEGTELAEFHTGDAVELRLTAGSLSLIDDRGSIKVGNVATSSRYEYVAIGNDVGSPGSSAVSLGPSSHAPDSADVAVGSEAQTQPRAGLPPGYITMPPNCTAMGRQSRAGSRAAVAVGTNATAEGELSTAVGNLAVAKKRFSQVLGGHSFAFAEGGTALGSCAVALQENSIAMGSGAVATLPFGRKSTTIPYLSYEGFPTPDPLIKGYVMANDMTYREVLEAAIVKGTPTPGGFTVPDDLSAALDMVGQVSEQVVLSSTIIDLTDPNATAMIVLPNRAMMFVDALDVVIMEANGAGGTPELRVSPYPGTPNTYLSGAAITKHTVGGRHTFASSNDDGTQMLFVSLATAGTGTLKAKVVARGYIMEMSALDQTGLGEESDLVRFRPTPTASRWGWPSGGSSAA
ncbi:hypothetical protein Q9247_09715 [Halomonas meridiana]|uniref:hypothetical protein n=1 Tax=Vreelandella aquamarina TaxID=77097 RepID=UPI00273BB156|nr:hypothetical protein [Halomonas meridiana]MDP4557959.1 hypothetical protein [Halomonas meridiana]